MTYNVFGGTLSLTQSIINKRQTYRERQTDRRRMKYNLLGGDNEIVSLQ